MPPLCSISNTFRQQVFPPNVVGKKNSKGFNYWDTWVINKLVPLWYATALVQHTKIKQKGKWDLNASVRMNVHLLKKFNLQMRFQHFALSNGWIKESCFGPLHFSRLDVHFTTKHCVWRRLNPFSTNSSKWPGMRLRCILRGLVSWWECVRFSARLEQFNYCIDLRVLWGLGFYPR